VKALDVFMCWIDIQDFKSIPVESYRRSKALHIYHKYIKTNAILQIQDIPEADRAIYKVRILLQLLLQQYLLFAVAFAVLNCRVMCYYVKYTEIVTVILLSLLTQLFYRMLQLTPHHFCYYFLCYLIIYKAAIDLSTKDQSILSNEFYGKVQAKCFSTIYLNIYRKFKKTNEYKQLTEQVTVTRLYTLTYMCMNSYHRHHHLSSSSLS